MVCFVIRILGSSVICNNFEVSSFRFHIIPCLLIPYPCLLLCMFMVRTHITLPFCIQIHSQYITIHIIQYNHTNTSSIHYSVQGRRQQTLGYQWTLLQIISPTIGKYKARWANGIQQGGSLGLAMANQGAYGKQLRDRFCSCYWLSFSRTLLLTQLAQEAERCEQFVSEGLGARVQCVTAVPRNCSGWPWVSQMTYFCLAFLQLHVGNDSSTLSHGIVPV